MRKIVFCLLVIFAFPALAADGDIVYRVNLGRTADVKLLLDQGASPDQKDENGTPLVALAAARANNEGLNILKTLLAAKADINAADAKGQTALFYAARQGNKEVVDYLLAHGIEYYAEDANGEIARTLAYRAGHHDIVKQLDAFVNAQSKKVGEQYRDYQKAAEDRDKAMQPPPPAMDDEEEADTEEKEDAVQASADDMRELSFHSCAFQYWSFCREAGQTSELSDRALAEAIGSHREDVIALTEKAKKAWRGGGKYAEAISGYAKIRIVNDLDAMPSKTYRFEHGVCRINDLEERCGTIADSWSQKATRIIPKPPKPVSQKSLKSHSGSQLGGMGNKNP